MKNVMVMPKDSVMQHIDQRGFSVDDIHDFEKANAITLNVAIHIVFGTEEGDIIPCEPSKMVGALENIVLLLFNTPKRDVNNKIMYDKDGLMIKVLHYARITNPSNMFATRHRQIDG